ncbi:MAG: hypothetical protein VZR95_03085 [Alphaproteobacteria bacterium]
MGVKIELEKDEIGWLKIALDIARKDYNKTIENIQKNKKLKKTEKENLIKDLLDEMGHIEKLKKFFGSLK